MGMVKLMQDAENGETANTYNVTMYGTADEITAGIANKTIDIANVPCNLASVLYNKTEGGIKLLDINTLGVLYGISAFLEAARITSVGANTGLNYECDAIAACVIGGVSFVGGTGKISGVVMGVFLLRIIFVALNFLSINANLQYIIKGLIILVACAIDMRKYLVRK